MNNARSAVPNAERQAFAIRLCASPIIVVERADRTRDCLSGGRSVSEANEDMSRQGVIWRGLHDFTLDQSLISKSVNRNLGSATDFYIGTCGW